MDFLVATLRGALGLAVLIGIATLFSSDRRRIQWHIVGAGVTLQIVFALLVLKTVPGNLLFSWIGQGFAQLLNFTSAGAQFIFGPLGSATGPVGVVFAFQILPTIIFFGSIMSVLYYLKLVQPVVRVIGIGMAKMMRLSGAESLSAAANIFIGQTEAPLVVRPYIAGMTRSELFALMVGGMATIAGGVMAAYIQFLGGTDPVQQALFAKHLLSASIMNAPAALLLAKVMIPETGIPETAGNAKLSEEKNGDNVLEAAAAGASDGLMLALNVGAMLLAFIAIIALLNAILGWVGHPVIGTGDRALYNLNTLVADATGGRFQTLSLEALFGFLLAPLAWVIGVDWSDALVFGSLLGQKVAINEFVAYLALADARALMNERSVIIATYALCGFANFSSIAIQIGGIGGLAPTRRAEVAQLGLRAVLAGTLATLMSATIAGVLV